MRKNIDKVRLVCYNQPSGTPSFVFTLWSKAYLCLKNPIKIDISEKDSDEHQN